MAVATIKVQDRQILYISSFSAFGAFWKVLLLDVTVESILNHILSSVWKEFFYHLPFRTKLTVDFDDRLVLFGCESATPDFLVNFALVAFLGAQRRDEFIIEYFGYSLPILAVLFYIFHQKFVLIRGPELHQLLFGGKAFILHIISGNFLIGQV